jgi:hypothetical protein
MSTIVLYCTCSIPVLSNIAHNTFTAASFKKAKHRHMKQSHAISGSHGGENKGERRLGCCVLYSGKSLPTFQRCLLPPSSGRRSRTCSSILTLCLRIYVGIYRLFEVQLCVPFLLHVLFTYRNLIILTLISVTIYFVT